MATAAQTEANRKNAQKSTGPKTEEGKAASCRNRLSHGFTSSIFFLPNEEREEFNLLLADLHDEFQPATASEQILLEKMVQNQWLSLRAYRLQAIRLNGSLPLHYIHPDLSLLIRYHQSSDRGFLKARAELIKAQKERTKSPIGFESQKPAEPPAQAPEPPPYAVPEPPQMPDFMSLEDQIQAVMNEPCEEIVRAFFAARKASRKAA